MTENNEWRSKITRPALALQVGGFRPTNAPGASCFGEVRLARPGENWPEYRGKPLWPLCQLNLCAAPYKPANLVGLDLITVFISEFHMEMTGMVIESDDEKPYAGWFLRAYESIDGLVPSVPPAHDSPMIAFEAQWAAEAVADYPTHDTMPIDFDALGIGDYYEQDRIDGVHATKLGGWPSCIQSEPWWDYDPEGREFEYAFQIDSEAKSKWMWGDSGAGYVARSRVDPNRWALDFQFR